MKLKLIIYLALYAAVIAFMAAGINDSETALGQMESIDCRYEVIKNGEKKEKENNLDITTKKIKATDDSVYICLSIYNRGPEILTLGTKNFILMKNSNPICELRANDSIILPEKGEDIILSYSKSKNIPDRIEVVKYGGKETYQKLFSIRL